MRESLKGSNEICICIIRKIQSFCLLNHLVQYLDGLIGIVIPVAKYNFVSLAQRRARLVKEEYRVPQAKCGSWGWIWSFAGVRIACVVHATHIARELKKSECGLENKGDGRSRKVSDEAQRAIGGQASS